MMVDYAAMVESKNYYVHPVQSWWSIAILALAVGKRTGLLVGVRYIYLRKNVEIWWRVKRCYSTFVRKDSTSSLKYQNVVYL